VNLTLTCNRPSGTPKNVTQIGGLAVVAGEHRSQVAMLDRYRGPPRPQRAGAVHLAGVLLCFRPVGLDNHPWLIPSTNRTLLRGRAGTFGSYAVLARPPLMLLNVVEI
jgi:hypothetical protein